MSQENLAMVLAAYQRRKNLENMVAPLVSICIHILVALGLLLFYKPAAPQMESAVVEVKMQEEEIKEIEDEKVLEELDKLEQQADVSSLLASFLKPSPMVCERKSARGWLQLRSHLLKVIPLVLLLNFSG